MLERTACKKCMRGKYLVTEGANDKLACLPCDATGGQFSADGSASCTDCAKGSYMPPDAPDPKKNVCFTCPAGYFQDTTRQTVCKACPLGWHNGENENSPVDHESCSQCQAGRYADQVGLDQCKECPSGRYHTEVQLDSPCKVCPKGRVTKQRTGQTECEPCKAGEYLPEDLQGRDYCLPCNNDYEGAFTCDGCPAGKWGILANISLCESCAAGKYSLGGVSYSCLDCPAGYYGLPDGRIRDECEACVGGKYSNTAAALNMTVCASCGPGKFGSVPQGQSGADECLLCAKGRHSSKTGLANAAQCEPCSAGRRSIFEGWSGECEGCEAGRFSNMLGAAIQECHNCPAGFHQTKKNQTTCDACSPGFWQDAAGELDCKNCNPGLYQSSGKSTSCEGCPSGFYQPMSSQAYCLPCLPGRVGPSEQLTAGCNVCPRGRFMENVNSSASQCKACPVGWHQTFREQTSCAECAVGRFYNGSGASVCRMCPPGRYQSSSKGTTCTVCAQGQFQNKFEQVSCISCSPGMFTSNTSQTTCEECPRGTFQSAEGRTSCLDCSPGQYQNHPRQASCLLCIPGRFARGKANFNCTECAVGWIQKKEGMSNCTRPPPDMIVAEGGASLITIAKGWRASDCASGVCKDSEPCPAGWVGLENKTCAACKPGSMSFAGSVTCQPCELGKAALSSGSEKCTPCDERRGFYSDEIGLSTCKSCGRFQRSTRFKCEDVTVDERLPVVPSKPKIQRLPRSGADIWDDSSNAMIVSWAALDDKREKIKNPIIPTGLELELSTDSEFLINTIRYGNIPAEATSFTPPTSTTIPTKPLCDQVIYARVRSVNKSMALDRHSKWSATSETWRSTGKGDCGRQSQYLDCSITNEPLDWTCRPCPAGAKCEMPTSNKAHPFPYSVRWSQVRVAVGYWRDDRVKSTATSMESADSDLVPRKFKFAECASGNDIRKIMCPEGGADNTTERCATGYLDVCDPVSNGTCRLCRTCDYGYAMASDGMTCRECAPEGSNERKVTVILGVLATIFVLLVFSLLVYLRIRSSTGMHAQKKKAVHSTIKRILLSHMQVIMLCMGLRVPWPDAIQTLMEMFKTLSSVRCVHIITAFFFKAGSYFVYF